MTKTESSSSLTRSKVYGTTIFLAACLLTQASAEVISAGKLYIDLNAEDLQLKDGDPVEIWNNRTNSEIGHFRQGGEEAPQYSTNVGGRPAVTFNGINDRMETYEVEAPPEILGDGSWSVEAWVFNPSIEEEEAIFSWAARNNGVNATAQINYGSSPTHGAVTHYGDGDLGFEGGLPRANAWHHIVVTYNGSVERVYVDGKLNASESKDLHLASPPMQFMILGAGWDPKHLDHFFNYSGSIAQLRLHGGTLSESDVIHNFNLDAANFGLARLQQERQ